jgi:selenocysteine-specific elongation factor
VLLVVAADDGWAAQTQQHAEAIAALGLDQVLPVVTRCDLANGERAAAESVDRLARLGIRARAGVMVSGRTGVGLPGLRTAVGDMAKAVATADADAPVRLWVDRSFTVRGAGTVATGTLAAGTLSIGDALLLRARQVRVRGLQTCGEPAETVTAPARVAVNLRGVDVAGVSRGDALLDPAAGGMCVVFDAELTPSAQASLTEAMLHVGTAAVSVRVRRLGGTFTRLTLSAPLPLRPGDRAVLRDPGRRAVLSGVRVLALDPEPFRRRGAAARRVDVLASGRADEEAHGAQPTGPHRPAGSASGPGLEALLEWLDRNPFRSPAAAQVRGWGVTAANLAQAQRDGRIVRLSGLILDGDAPARALSLLAALPAQFTAGDAARAMGTSRRIAIPLLERLDEELATRRDPSGWREVRTDRPIRR